MTCWTTAMLTTNVLFLIAVRSNTRLPLSAHSRGTIYRVLFSTYLTDIEADRHSSKIFTDFVEASWVSRDYLRETSPAGLARDFIAGMTDRYFLKRFEECVLPHRIEGTFR